MQKNQILNREQIKVNFFNIENLTVQHPHQDKQKVYSICNHPDWVNVVAETKDGQIVLVKQWRAGTDTLEAELPGGKVDEGEDPEIAGLRELTEETGYALTEKSRVIPLGYVLANPAIQDNKMHFFYVNNVEKSEDTDFDEFENLITALTDKKEISNLIKSQQISHAYSVLGLNRALKW